MEKVQTFNQNNTITNVVLSVFEHDGPTPISCIPNNISEEDQTLIAMKTISLLMGEQIYQNGGFGFDSIKYFGILPFPDLKLTGLTYFFLIRDEKARGKAKAATISLLIEEKKAYFLYENTKQLSLILGETAGLLLYDLNEEKTNEIMNLFAQKILNYVSDVNTPVEFTRKLKVLFVGLDNSGKTSYLRAIKQKFSELTDVKPTKGVERTEINILGQDLKEWDLGGQEKYRQSYIKNADLYLIDTNLLFYFIDIKDEDRFDEALDYFQRIITILKSFNQFPPIIINFHKLDPDLPKNPDLEQKLDKLQKDIINSAKKFNIGFFKTSIFNAYSLNKSFSHGINSLSPNREIFYAQLKWFAQQLNAKSMLLLNESSLIISDFAINNKVEMVSEISAPHFQNLYRTFKDFKMLPKNQAIWQMENSLILFHHFEIADNSLYLLAFLDNCDDVQERFDENIELFKEKITLLIQTYL